MRIPNPTFLVVPVPGQKPNKSRVSFIYEVPSRKSRFPRSILGEGDSLLVNKCAVENFFYRNTYFHRHTSTWQDFRLTNPHGTIFRVPLALGNRVNFNFRIYFRQSDLLYTLPCSWNLQLSDNSLSGIYPLTQKLL